MNKLLLVTTLCLSFFLTACTKTSTPTDTTMTGKQELPAYMSGNYDALQHYLNLRSQNLTQMPDICTDITIYPATGTSRAGNILYDIRYIDLGDNQITDINADYGCLPNLQELNLSYNKITSIENLEKLTFLSKLQLHKNQITKIKWLDKLTKLSELNLGYNQLTSVKWLEANKNLITLELQHNQITDIGRLANLRNLETLKVEYNQIKDPIQFAAIKEAITWLKNFTTWGNM